MEKLAYEFRPYSLVVLGVLAFAANNESLVNLASVAVLIFAGLYMLHIRKNYRKHKTARR